MQCHSALIARVDTIVMWKAWRTILQIYVQQDIIARRDPQVRSRTIVQQTITVQRGVVCHYCVHQGSTSRTQHRVSAWSVQVGATV